MAVTARSSFGVPTVNTREAAVMATPSVMVRGSTAAEIIRDGENGFLCQDDAQDLARVIKNALNDPQRLKQVGQNACETIPVPWETIMKTVEERYARLVALGREGRLRDKRIRIV